MKKPLLKNLGDALENVSHSFYDYYVEANVKARQALGVKQQVIRRQVLKCCDWCADLAGIYTYPNVPGDVWARHNNCRCQVTFISERNGTYKDVWSKQEYKTQREARISRIKEIEKAEAAEKQRKHNLLHPINPVTGEVFVSHEVIIPKEQFGKKARTHALDYNLDPSNAADRQKLLAIINDIIHNANEIEFGEWRDQEYPVTFYIKGDDVVVESAKKKFVTILKGGVSNARVKASRTRK